MFAFQPVRCIKIIPNMETAKIIAWARFWEERGRSYPDDDPIAIDGRDHGISLMGLEKAELLPEQITRELALTSHSKLLEVGCGPECY